MDFAPMIDVQALPDEEQVHGGLIGTQLSLLKHHVGTFRDAVELIDYCRQKRNRKEFEEFSREELDQRRQYAKWQILAARDAVFSVYHLQSSLRSVRDQLRNTPNLREQVDTKALQAAYCRIDDEFPTWKETRHAVAHWADQIFSINEKDKNWPEGYPMIFSGFNADRSRLYVMRAQNVLHLDVTKENLDRLESIKEQAWDSFRTAALQFP